MDEFQKSAEKTWPDKLKGYKYRIIVPGLDAAGRARPTADDLSPCTTSVRPRDQRGDPADPRRRSAYLYYGAVRAGPSCVGCHRNSEQMAAGDEAGAGARPNKPGLVDPNLKPAT